MDDILDAAKTDQTVPTEPPPSTDVPPMSPDVSVGIPTAASEPSLIVPPPASSPSDTAMPSAAEEFAQTNPPSDVPPAEPVPDMPESTEPPKKSNMGGKRNIKVLLAGLVLLIVSLPLIFFAVRQQAEIRGRAACGYGEGWCAGCINACRLVTEKTCSTWIAETCGGGTSTSCSGAKKLSCGQAGCSVINGVETCGSGGAGSCVPNGGGCSSGGQCCGGRSCTGGICKDKEPVADKPPPTAPTDSGGTGGGGGSSCIPIGNDCNVSNANCCNGGSCGGSLGAKTCKAAGGGGSSSGNACEQRGGTCSPLNCSNGLNGNGGGCGAPTINCCNPSDNNDVGSCTGTAETCNPDGTLVKCIDNTLKNIGSCPPKGGSCVANGANCSVTSTICCSSNAACLGGKCTPPTCSNQPTDAACPTGPWRCEGTTWICTGKPPTTKPPIATSGACPTSAPNYCACDLKCHSDAELNASTTGCAGICSAGSPGTPAENPPPGGTGSTGSQASCESYGGSYCEKRCHFIAGPDCGIAEGPTSCDSGSGRCEQVDCFNSSGQYVQVMSIGDCSEGEKPKCTGDDCGGGGGKSQCVDIRIYKDGKVLTTKQIKTLQPGDKVTLALKATGKTTKARFKVNGTDWEETTTKNADKEFTLEWTVPPNTKKFTIEGERSNGKKWE